MRMILTHFHPQLLERVTTLLRSSFDVGKTAYRQFARYLEAGLLAIGLTFLAIFVVFRIHGGVSSRAALEKFAGLESRASGTNAAAAPPGQRGPDFGL